MKLIEADSIVEGWLAAANHLEASQFVDTTLVVCIDAPGSLNAQDRGVMAALDHFLSNHKKFSNHTVAETIFPGYEYVRRGSDGVYTYPDRVAKRLTDHQDRRWGTYAERILSRTDEEGNSYSPLRDCIAKMRSKSQMRARYEIDLGFGFDLGLYDDRTDRQIPIGSPCLSHLSFKLINRKVHLTALYRSHYYVQKALGNFLGLARLQTFVANELALSCGPLVCHSTMATLETDKKDGWGKQDVRSLLTECREVFLQSGRSNEITQGTQTA